MKYWFTFGFGLILGLGLGAFLTAFLLFDDIAVPEKQTKLKATSLAVHQPSVKKVPSTKKSYSPPQIIQQPVEKKEEKPVAIPAEAVDLDSLPSTEINDTDIITSVKRDDDEITPTSTP